MFSISPQNSHRSQGAQIISKSFHNDNENKDTINWGNAIEIIKKDGSKVYGYYRGSDDKYYLMSINPRNPTVNLRVLKDNVMSITRKMPNHNSASAKSSNNDNFRNLYKSANNTNNVNDIDIMTSTNRMNSMNDRGMNTQYNELKELINKQNVRIKKLEEAIVALIKIINK